MTTTGVTTAPVRAVQVVALVVGPALVMLDSGIANVAVAPLAQQFDRPVTTAQWIVSAYLLAIAVGLTATTQLTRRFGVRRVYVVSLLAFIAASAACGLATDLPVLIGLRVVQGLAGAPLVPLAMTGLMPSSDDGGPSQVSPAIGAVLFMAPVLGPPVAGLVLTVATWPWLFVINVPLGLAGLWFSRHLTDEIFPARRTRQEMDVAGFLVLAPGVVLLVLAGASVGHGVGREELLAVGVGGLALIGLYVRHARRAAAPLVDVSPVSTRPSAAALAASVLTSVVAFSLVVLVPIFAQGAQGYSAVVTGLALLPQGLAVGVGTGIAYAVSRRASLRTTIVVGLVLLLTSLAGMYLLVGADTPLWITALLLSGRGLAVGLVIQPLLSGWLSAVAPDVKTDCTTIFATVERIGGSIGIASIVSLYDDVLTRSGPTAAIRTVVVVLGVLTALVLALTPFLPSGRSPSTATPHHPGEARGGGARGQEQGAQRLPPAMR